MMTFEVARDIQAKAHAGIEAVDHIGFDYHNQAWVIEGGYVSCGHPERINCDCFGRIAQESHQQQTQRSTNPTGLEHVLTMRVREPKRNINLGAIMAKISIAEKRFTAEYPNWNIRRGTIRPVELYVGDYICSEAGTRADAFREALKQVEAGNIKPDHMERQTEGIEITLCYGFTARL